MHKHNIRYIQPLNTRPIGVEVYTLTRQYLWFLCIRRRILWQTVNYQHWQKNWVQRFV